MRSTPSAHLLPLWIAMAILSVWILNGCTSVGDDKSASYGSASFPVPPELQDNVDFWRKVYGEWGTRQVAFHDDEYMGIIYEVATLPGGTGNSYSGSQSQWVKARVAYYQQRLRELQSRVQNGESLSASDRKLLARFTPYGGKSALYGAADRVRSQRGLRERFKRGLEISGRYDSSFREIMRAHQVPEDLAYLPHVESSFQTNARSSVGAGGVWQFMPGTGRLFMTVNSRVDERYDPILAADGAARYLAQAYRKLGSWPLAITSYNHGQAGMMRAQSIYGNDIGKIAANYQGRYFGFASRNFYAEFVAAREVASHPHHYFPEGVHYASPWEAERLVLHDNLPVDALARHYGISRSTLVSMNQHWTDRVDSGRLSIPAGTSVWLPKGTLRRVPDQPDYADTMLASTRPARPISTQRIARIEKPAPEARHAAAPEPRVAAVSRPGRSSTSARYHVVKPQETLYRVAVQNGLTVEELRRLNKISPNDNHIQPGQKLKVGS